MAQAIRYGVGSVLDLELQPSKVLDAFTGFPGTPLDDPAAAVAAAVSDPLDFPPLTNATVPGDQIVIALDQGLPQSQEAVAGVVHTLLDGNASPEEITLLVPEGSDNECLQSLPSKVQQHVKVTPHEPDNRKQLAYLAASRDGKAIYLNRLLCDADVVIPISTLRLQNTVGYYGVHSGIYPLYSDRDTQQRFRAPGNYSWEAHRRRRREEVAEVAWLLGVQFTIQLAPGPQNEIFRVLAGESHHVELEGQDVCAALWQRKIRQRVGLVIASMEGGSEHQTWDNFARALYNAGQAVADGGAIVLCTDLEYEPGNALHRLASMASDDELLHDLRRDRSEDAVSATLLCETLQRSSIYLISRLPDELLEDIGVRRIDGADEIQRLSSQYESCILLENAHYAAVEGFAATVQT